MVIKCIILNFKCHPTMAHALAVPRLIPLSMRDDIIIMYKHIKNYLCLVVETFHAKNVTRFVSYNYYTILRYTVKYKMYDSCLPQQNPDVPLRTLIHCTPGARRSSIFSVHRMLHVYVFIQSAVYINISVQRQYTVSRYRLGDSRGYLTLSVTVYRYRMRQNEP